MVGWLCWGDAWESRSVQTKTWARDRGHRVWGWPPGGPHDSMAEEEIQGSAACEEAWGEASVVLKCEEEKTHGATARGEDKVLKKSKRKVFIKMKIKS